MGMVNKGMLVGVVSGKKFPLVLLIMFVLIPYYLITHGPTAKPQPVERKLPPVRVFLAESQSVNIPVYTRGTVYPKIKVKLSAEVSGRVLEVSPKLANGSFISKGEVLLRISDDQVLLEKKKAESQLATAVLTLDKTKAQYKTSTAVQGVKMSTLAQGIPQIKEAEVRVEVAQAVLDQIEDQLTKTTLRAPFNGRVNLVSVGVGELISMGQPIAEIYGIDAVEVRLPLSDAQYRLINIPTAYFDANGEQITTLNEQKPNVILREPLGQFFWNGRLERSEGSIDLRNRLRYVIAQVDAPYTLDPTQPGRPPLDAGLFVDAMIEGKKFDNVMVLPRNALRKNDEVWVVDSNNRLHIKDVVVVHRGHNKVYINDGLEPGELIITTAMEVVIEGMEVAIVTDKENNGSDDADLDVVPVATAQEVEQ